MQIKVLCLLALVQLLLLVGQVVAAGDGYFGWAGLGLAIIMVIVCKWWPSKWDPPKGVRQEGRG